MKAFVPKVPATNEVHEKDDDSAGIPRLSSDELGKVRGGKGRVTEGFSVEEGIPTDFG